MRQRARRLFISVLIVVVLLAGCSDTDTDRNTNDTSPANTSPALSSESVSTDSTNNNIETESPESEDSEASDAVEIPVNNPSTPEVDADNQQTYEQIKLDGVLKAHFIDVGQADCVYIELPNKENMLIDAGNNGDRETILDYLYTLGVKKLDYVIGTHPHEDHIGSLDAVIDNYSIGSIYMPKASSNTKTFEDVLTAIQAKGLKVKAPESGSYILNLKNQIDKDTVKDELVIQFLAPNSNLNCKSKCNPFDLYRPF